MPADSSFLLRDILAKAFLFGFSIALAMLFGEIALRALGHRGVEMLDMSERVYQVDDPVLDWRYKPNREYSMGDVVYAFNSAGFRDIEHDIKKPRGVTRVVVIGDSVTVGYGVKAADIFASQVVRFLGDRFEVVNIAMSGTNSPQVVHLLEAEGLTYQPDVVVMNLVLNDCDFPTIYENSVAFRRSKDSQINLLGIRIDPRVKRLLKSSALVYFLNQHAERLIGGQDNPHGDYVHRIWNEPENREKISNSFERLAELKAIHGFDLLILIWPVIADFDDYAYASIHSWVAKEAEVRGIDVIDLLPSFAERGDHDTYYLSPNDYFHPNAKGHEVAAKVFQRWMNERTIPSRRGS